MISDDIQKYTELASRYQQLTGQLNEKISQLESLQKTVVEDEKKLELFVEVVDVVEVTGQFYQQQVFEKIDSLVTQALRVIFEDDTWEFKTKLEYKRNQPEAYFEPSRVTDGRKIKGDLLFINGGGFIDVISVALRLIIAELCKQPGFISLDEPARMLSTSYLDNFAKFLYEYSHRVDRQLIIITHSNQIASIADKRFGVKQNADGISHVTVL